MIATTSFSDNPIIDTTFIEHQSQYTISAVVKKNIIKLSIWLDLLFLILTYPNGNKNRFYCWP